MATSGTFDFNVTVTELIESSARVALILGVGETLEDAHYKSIKQSLNMMLKAWQNESIGIWLKHEIKLPVVSGTQRYLLGPGGNAYFPEWDYNTTTSAAASSGDTQISVTSTDHINSGERIGIVLDDGTVQWVTATSGTNPITFATALTDDVASGNAVYHFIPNPKRIDTANYVYSSGSETILNVENRSEYTNLNNKSQTGQANIVYFEYQLTNSNLRVWPTGNSTSGDVISMTARFEIEDVGALSDNLQVPSEFLEAIKFNLAMRIAPEFGISLPKNTIDQAIEYKRRAWNFDIDDTPVYLQPDNVGW